MPFTTTGAFVPKTTTEIQEEIQSAVLSQVDNTLDLSPDQPIGQIIGIMAEREAALWELLSVAYNAFDRDKAEFYLLDSLGALTGTLRLGATKTLVKNAQVNLTAGTTLPAGSKASVVGRPELVLQTTAAVTNSGPVTNWFSVDFEAQEVGVLAVNSSTLTVISVAVPGWVAVNNDPSDPAYGFLSPAATALGSDVEVDSAYRVRQKQELPNRGSSSVDAIRAALLVLLRAEVPGGQEIEAFVFENITNSVDVDGVPAHAFEAVIFDGLAPVVSNTKVAQVIWDNKPTGIQAYGAIAATAVDTLGANQSVSFSRATVRPVYITVTVQVDSTYPSNGDTLVQEAIVAEGLNFILGEDVRSLKLKCVTLDVQGVLDVALYKQAFTPSPVADVTLITGSRAIATFSAANISVTHV